MSSTTEADATEAPLEDLMVAMDVVDTLRHRDLMVDRELDSEGRRQRLLARLREIYEAQGIAVTDDALAAGVDALEEDRFSYTPAANSFATRLARIYVSRGRWLRPFLGIVTLGLVIWFAYFYMVQLPESREHDILPQKIATVHERISAISKSDAATRQANSLFAQTKVALGADDYSEAEKLLAQLQTLRANLEQSYEIRIVSRPNEISGVWRVPDVNPDARNYYLIVEAVTTTGRVVPVSIRNEESGRDQQAVRWGLRVSGDTFEAVAADKRDDGIIQGNVVGTKQVGQIEPEYRIPTSGAAITDW